MDIQWHTEARQQPRIIGKDSSGRKIPGGPYTIYQVLAVGGVVPAAMMGFKIIDGGMTIRGFIFALAAGWLAQFIVGRIEDTDTIHKLFPHSKSEPTPRKPLHPTGNAVRRSGLEAFLAAAEKES